MPFVASRGTRMHTLNCNVCLASDEPRLSFPGTVPAGATGTRDLPAGYAHRLRHSYVSRPRRIHGSQLRFCSELPFLFHLLHIGRPLLYGTHHPGTEVREGQNRRADRVSQPCAHDAATGSTREYPTPTRVLVGLLVVQVVYTTLKNTSIVLGGGGREPYYETAQSRKR
jgi:hypothetical protein